MTAKLSFRMFVLALFPMAFAWAPMDAAAALTPAPTGKILLSRSAVDDNGIAHGSRLFRVNADGSNLHALTPATEAIYDSSPTWSPGGGQIAFERRDAIYNRSDIYLMDSQGAGLRKLTSGTDSFRTPVWGPGGTIAFVAVQPDGSCVATIRSDGSNQHNVFCLANVHPRTTPLEFDPPVWADNGRTMYLSAGFTQGLDQYWVAFVYRIDVRTGDGKLLLKRSTDGRPTASIAPDASNVVYGYSNITRVDLATGDETVLVDDAYRPLYSPDGSHIAFSRRFFVGGDPTVPPGNLRFNHLFVMDADGSNVQQLTKGTVDNLEYTAVDWSRDGHRILLNRVVSSEDDRERPIDPRESLRIIDVATHAMKVLPGGHADGGAWFQGP